MQQILKTETIIPLTKTKKFIKSPLRYPGGKSRAVKQILPIIPYFDEMREPMVGGGSVFFALKQIYPNKKFWINDINRDLYLFWRYCKENNAELIREIQNIKNTRKNGRELYSNLTKNNNYSDFERAVRFFILNRITFSGTVDSGGYSQQAFEKRFTDSSIERIKFAEIVLRDVKITNEDYENVINTPGENVFIFLDPPYLSTVKSRLYGKNGELHEIFDHEKYSKNMRKCRHNWLITYDNSPEVIDLFDFANIYEWELQYGMNNYKQKTAAKGRELFISNYEIPVLAKSKIN